MIASAVDTVNSRINSRTGAIPRRALRDWPKKLLTVVLRTLKMLVPQPFNQKLKGKNGKTPRRGGRFALAFATGMRIK